MFQSTIVINENAPYKIEKPHNTATIIIIARRYFLGTLNCL